ncbi:MAG: transposase [Myxococcota bacterium]|nr:transposase [Myxococcota bacterium]
MPTGRSRRAGVPKGCPAHVTIRVREEIPSLRTRRFVAEFRASLRKACERGEFRVAHYSVQRDHVHLIVEAAGKRALGCGMKSISARLARAVNRVFARSGRVLDGRYHLHLLRTPREVRNALAYVLLNARKHWRERRGKAPLVRLDEASSGRWFAGWKRRVPGPRPAGGREVALPRSWLLRSGWRRYGLVDPGEVPGGREGR